MSFRVFIVYTTSCLVARKVEETENLKFMLVSWVVKQWNIRNARISVFFFWLQFLGNQLVLISIRKFVQILSGSSENCTQVMESEIWSLTLLLRLGFWMFWLNLEPYSSLVFFTFQLLQQRTVYLLLQRWQSHLISLRRSEYTIGILFCDRALANICAWIDFYFILFCKLLTSKWISDSFCLFSLFLLWCIYFKLVYLFLHFGWWIDILFMLS